MGRVHVLPANLVNKIAAGEVIERPASVVKELVENALDAGASRIEIAIEAGGKGLVRVADDGVGMDRDDLALCVQPHATSKLNDESDLFALHTMGFRGEALPSIGSVSQMRLCTRTADSDAAWAVDVDGGRIAPPTPAAGSPGTVVEVRNLFFNTPARRKFLKADSTEMAQISEALARIALAHTEVAFRLTHNGRLAYDLPATEDLARRIGDFFGGDLADTLMPVDLAPADDQSPGIRGLIAPPQHSRPSAKWQYVFLNGRYIRDRFVQHAMREAYRGLMEPSRQPVVFLFILLPPELVDFNVHPTKIEVRFADSNRIHSAVLRALRDRLTRTDLTHAGRGPREASTPEPDEPIADEDESARQERIRLAMAEFFRRAEPVQRRMVFEPEAGAKQPTEPLPPYERRAAATPLFEGRPGQPPSPDAPDAPPTDASAAARVGDVPRERIDLPPPGAPVVQIHNTYLVTQTDDGLLIIDQHALHERIMYETLYARLVDPAKAGLQGQRLLIPQRVSLGEPQVALLLENEGLLAQLGIELSRFGRGEVAIQSFPALLERLDPAQFIRDLADRLADAPPSGKEAFVHEVLDMMACKAAVKAGDPLTPEEIAALLAQRDLVERSSNCPHGRPTTLRFSIAELEKQFKRR
ncbi:MAG: DNA mismatch repair protein MutL [Phycisphaerae bacterium]|nr:DNA mismatch repair protein MutL [Phycisphaerae bacterium]